MVESAYLLIADQGQTGVKRVEFSDLNIRPIETIFGIGELNETALAHVRCIFGAEVGCAHHAVERTMFAVQAHADVDEVNATRHQNIEDASSRGAFVNAHERECHAVQMVSGTFIDVGGLDMKPVSEILVPALINLGLATAELCRVKATRRTIRRVDVEGVAIETENFRYRRAQQQVEQIGPSSTEPNDSDALAGKSSIQIGNLRARGQSVLELEDGVGLHRFHNTEGMGAHTVALDRRTRDDRDVALDLLGKVIEFAFWHRLVREGALHRDVADDTAQLKRCFAAAEVGNCCPVELMWMTACEIDLMIVLLDALGIDEDQFGDDRTGLQCTRPVEIGDISDDQAVAVERDREAALDQHG